jgi:acyl carrier protein
VIFENELQQIFSRIFQVPYSDYINWNYDQVVQWDSLAQISLILEIEDYWGIQIESEEIPRLKRYSDFADYLSMRIKNTGNGTSHE